MLRNALYGDCESDVKPKCDDTVAHDVLLAFAVHLARLFAGVLTASRIYILKPKRCIKYKCPNAKLKRSFLRFKLSLS